MPNIDPLDVPVWGATAIAGVLNLRHTKGKRKGKPNTRAAYHLLEAGRIDADKNGGGLKATWSSTPRRLLKIPRT
jgi:hypothetical protein